LGANCARSCNTPLLLKMRVYIQYVSFRAFYRYKHQHIYLPGKFCPPIICYPRIYVTPWVPLEAPVTDYIALHGIIYMYVTDLDMEWIRPYRLDWIGRDDCDPVLGNH